MSRIIFNENIMKKTVIICLLFALLITVAGVFCCANPALAEDSSYLGLTISEIMYNPAGNNSEHAKWIEFSNLSSDKITLIPAGNKTASGWKIKDIKITDSSNHYLYTQENMPIDIEPGDFFIVVDNLINFGNDYSNFKDVPILKSAITLTTSDSSGNNNLTLFDNSFVLDTITYSKSWYENTDDKGESLEKIDLSGDNEKTNWQESCKNSGTPGKELEICEKVEVPVVDNSSKENQAADTVSDSGNSGATGFTNITNAEKVYLNEILPNPKAEEEKEEYIEIINQENGPVDLFSWMIRDGSKTGKYVFKEHTEIKSGEYLAVYRPESKLSLNNSKETVTLFNPQGEITSSVSWDKSIESSSYNFDGENWKWSKYLTPGEKNKFDSEPTMKITKPKHAYKDLYTDFSAKAKDKETKKLKYSWDFGDGKKSYTAKTSHKYLDTGKYTVTLTVSDDSQTVEKRFVLAVKKYPRPDLEIVKIIPNPVGNDSDGETIGIKNNSKKKIDLAGWKIASGSDDKIYNHPISGEISLEPNETKTITRETCKFSLNNKAGKIQLVMPDGKVADVVEYQKEKIADDEAYEKINSEWKWIAPNALEETDDPEEMDDSKDTQNEELEEKSDGEILGAADKNVSYFSPTQPEYTLEDEFIFYKFFGLQEYQPREANFCPAIQPANTLAYF
jgi:hypothetical protein